MVAKLDRPMLGSVRTDMRGRFKRLFTTLLCGALLAPVGPSSAAEDTVITLTVIADPVKANGSPWDGTIATENCRSPL